MVDHKEGVEGLDAGSLGLSIYQVCLLVLANLV